jgi:hypothetical protein
MPRKKNQNQGTEKEEVRYQIEMSDRQMSIMQDALEFYSRFLHGQVDYIPSCLDWRLKQDHRTHINPKIKEALNTIKREMFGLEHENSHWGIGTSHIPTMEDDKKMDEPQISYEMYKMILYTWRQEKMETCKKTGEDPGWTVHDSLPLKYSSEKLISIKRNQISQDI